MSYASESATLDEQVIEYMRKNKSVTVAQVHYALLAANPRLSKADTTDLVWRLARASRIAFEKPPERTESLVEYMKLGYRNLWFYASLVTCVATLISIYFLPSSFPLVIIRWVLGSIFVTFIPGYLAVAAIFREERQANEVETVVLSLALSFALVICVGGLLNYTAWGITLNSLLVSITILSVGLAVIALMRRFVIAREMRHIV